MNKRDPQLTQPRVELLPEALETSDEGLAEVAKTGRFVEVTMRDEANSVRVSRNCTL
jgi:hypothetical protein